MNNRDLRRDGGGNAMVDMKTRTANVFSAISEWNSGLKKNEDELQRELGKRAEAQKDTEALRVEETRLRAEIARLHNVKKTMEDENTNLQSESERRRKEAEAETTRNLEESRRIKHETEKIRVELTSEKHAFEEMKRDLETRQAKMAELVGAKK